MTITDSRIDSGTPFDWGRTSGDYARYRDIYPPVVYQKIAARGLCVRGQRVLDVGTGTGVLPRNMYGLGADWVGTDISPRQIERAKSLAEATGQEIEFRVAATETLDFPDAEFDVITACTCFFYFDHEKAAPNLRRMLRPDGHLLVLYMSWLPFEDRIAGASEDLVLKHNPLWSGAHEKRRPVHIPEAVERHFRVAFREEYDVAVPFTRKSWHGRMRACRGVGASLPPEKLAAWDFEHRALLERTAPEKFSVLHYVAFADLVPRS